jgi:hypothetical protein
VASPRAMIRPTAVFGLTKVVRLAVRAPVKCGRAGLGLWLGGSKTVAGVECWRMLAGSGPAAGDRMNGEEPWFVWAPLSEESSQDLGDLVLDILAINALDVPCGERGNVVEEV